MEINLGKTDKMIRIILGLILIIFVFIINFKNRYLSFLIILIGIILLLTVKFNSCPIYSIFGISTKKSRIKKISKEDIQNAVKSYEKDKIFKK